MTIELGSKVKDPITGFEGIAISRTIYLTGCAVIGVRPPMGKDGKEPDVAHFDEPMLNLLETPGKTGISRAEVQPPTPVKTIADPRAGTGIG